MTGSLEMDLCPPVGDGAADGHAVEGGVPWPPNRPSSRRKRRKIRDGSEHPLEKPARPSDARLHVP